MKGNHLTKCLALLLACGVCVGGAWLLTRSIGPGGTCDVSRYDDPTRDALVLAEGCESAYLDQGWEPRDSMDFYTRPQGSRLLPYDWFVALERADDDSLFRDPEHMNRLRFLTQKPNACNPDGLPVGFTKDPVSSRYGVPWLGFTCAACHTTELHHDGKAIRIDGGPSMADIQTFLLQLTAALRATLDDPAKFDRFADRLDANDTNRLREELREVFEERTRYDVLNAVPHAYGFARLDAFGRILNSVLVDGLEVDTESQRRPPDAPVSYPFLWDAPHHDFVQWNGIGRNYIAGSERLSGLARNVGQVLGVFGEVHVSPPNTATVTTGYPTSARVPDLIHLEGLVRKLRSPTWPEFFPAIDEGRRAEGEALFDRYCLRCHARIDRADPDRRVRAVLTPLDEIGTDPRMARNFTERRAKTGRLEGRRQYFMAGDRFDEEAPADEILSHVVIGAVLSSPVQDYKEADLRELRSRARDDGDTSLLVYKSRPLNGIWATAPFLHNGSVPNLYELLLPAGERSLEFHVGSREFDPVKVGFVTEPTTGSFLFRVSEPGNLNAGHEYGTGHDGMPALTDEERWALVEFLKSL